MNVLQPHSFELEEDTSSYKGYVRGGIVAQFKRPKQLAFQPLQQAIESPGEFLFSDFSKIERPGLLHVAFQALDAFQVSSRTAPLCCSLYNFGSSGTSIAVHRGMYSLHEEASLCSDARSGYSCTTNLLRVCMYHKSCLLGPFLAY